MQRKFLYSLLALLGIIAGLGGGAWYKRHLEEVSSRAVGMAPLYCPKTVDEALASFINTAEVADVALSMFGTSSKPGFGIAFSGNYRKLAALADALEAFKRANGTCIKQVSLFPDPGKEYLLYLHFKEDPPAT